MVRAEFDCCAPEYERAGKATHGAVHDDANREVAVTRSTYFRIAALILGMFVAIAAVEILLRLFELAPDIDVTTVTTKEYESIPGIYQPGQDFVSRENLGLPYRVRINELGYRGTEFPREKPRREVRIFMVGDSFVYGDFVEEEETLPFQLETALRSRCANVRVINAGLRGGTIVGEEILVRRGLELSPDLVLLVFHDNDIENLAAPLWPAISRNRELKSRFPLSILYPLLRRTALWNIAMQLRGQARAIAQRDSKNAHSQDDVTKESSSENGPSDALRAEYQARLLAMRDELATGGRVYLSQLRNIMFWIR